MKNGLLASLAFLTITSLLVYRLSLSASSPVDSLAAEAAARKADADWAGAASAASVDAWMSFYAADAIVLLPNDQLASGKELVRQTVTRRLAIPPDGGLDVAIPIGQRPSRMQLRRVRAHPPVIAHIAQ
jgi:hypothetical protein